MQAHRRAGSITTALALPASLCLLGAAPPGAAGTREAIADTGAAVTWAIVAAVVLLTAGVVLLLARHRMRTDATEERLRRERLHRDERSGGEGHDGEAYHGEGRDGEGHDGEAPGP